MNLQEENRLIEAVNTWAEAHPTPDLPVLAFGNDQELTPLQIAQHMRQRDKVGEKLLHIFDSLGTRVSIEEIIDDLFAETYR
jgi:hypothetical protein